MLKAVTIIGVGALGSHVAQFLRNEANLRVIDFDHIESKNTLSQFHGKTNVRKNKSQSLQQLVQFLFGVKIDVNSNKLIKDNACQLLGKPDLLIDCLDNFEARKIVQDYARKEAIPCLHGALGAEGAFGRVVWDESFVIDAEVKGLATCDSGDFLPFIALVSSLLSRSAQEFIKKDKKIGFEVHPTGVIST
jgi:molybdopterin-synthase adenylyltransferase